MRDPVRELRDELQHNEQLELLQMARTINAVSDPRNRLVLVAALVLENARITDELSRARVRLGLPALPVYKPRVR